jgi:mRNA interferase MazF
MKRGDLVLAVARGDYGKPRPAVVVQADLFNPTHASLLVCLLTTELVDAPLFRLTRQSRKRKQKQRWHSSARMVGA